MTGGSGGPAPLRTAVIGGGYVGLVQAGGLARLGHLVRVGEKDEARLRRLQAGEAPNYEPGLDRLIASGAEEGRLSFHASNEEAVAGARVVFLALPTPSNPDGSVDGSILLRAVEQTAGVLEKGAVLAVKSTAPVGTAEQLGRMPALAGRGVRVVSNPEFLREGKAVDDFFHPDRIVAGSRSREAADAVLKVYEGLPGERIVTDPASAEMIKYAANAYLAARISFVNSIANLCEALGADAGEVLAGMGGDHRIGRHYLSPGPGYGGSCLPKDARALLAIAEQNGYDFSLLAAAVEVNERQRRRIVDKVVRALGGSAAGAAVGVWGLAFKAGTDDIRESPAVDLAGRLQALGASVRAYDPRAAAAGIEEAEDAVAAAAGADVLLVAAEWGEFLEVDLAEVRRVMRGGAVVDARNLLDRRAVEACGLSYEGVGR